MNNNDDQNNSGGHGGGANEGQYDTLDVMRKGLDSMRQRDGGKMDERTFAKVINRPDTSTPLSDMRKAAESAPTQAGGGKK